MIGYELLRDLGVELAASFVLHHHERWDGDGYPDGLAGAEIPFGSRLILVADAFDALTSDRAYRRASRSTPRSTRSRARAAGSSIRSSSPRCTSTSRTRTRRPRRRAARARPNMVFIDVGLVGLALGMLLGGRLGALADVSIRGTYLAFAAILLQLIAFPSDVLPWSTPSSVARVLWLVSYALLIWMLQLNIRLRGTPLVAAGLACNLVAIVANDGLMPVRRAALIAAAGATTCTTTASSSAIRTWRRCRPVGGAELDPVRERLLGRRRADRRRHDRRDRDGDGRVAAARPHDRAPRAQLGPAQQGRTSARPAWRAPPSVPCVCARRPCEGLALR